jgi:hypothetical protein
MRSHPLPRCAERWWLNDESLATAGGIKTHCNFASHALALGPSGEACEISSHADELQPRLTRGTVLWSSYSWVLGCGVFKESPLMVRGIIGGETGETLTDHA